jgi:hypothetical protein
MGGTQGIEHGLLEGVRPDVGSEGLVTTRRAASLATTRTPPFELLLCDMAACDHPVKATIASSANRRLLALCSFNMAFSCENRM